MNPWLRPQTSQNEIRRVEFLRIGLWHRAQMTGCAGAGSQVSPGSSDLIAPLDSLRARVRAGLPRGGQRKGEGEWVGPACAGPSSAGWR
jgi:hypothetical protein